MLKWSSHDTRWTPRSHSARVTRQTGHSHSSPRLEQQCSQPSLACSASTCGASEHRGMLGHHTEVSPARAVVSGGRSVLRRTSRFWRGWRCCWRAAKEGRCRVTTTRGTSRWRLISGSHPIPANKTLTSVADATGATTQPAAHRLLQTRALRRRNGRICTPQTTLRGSHPSLSGMRPSFDMRRTAVTRAPAQGDRYMVTLAQVRVIITDDHRLFLHRCTLRNR